MKKKMLLMLVVFAIVLGGCGHAFQRNRVVLDIRLAERVSSLYEDKVPPTAADALLAKQVAIHAAVTAKKLDIADEILEELSKETEAIVEQAVADLEKYKPWTDFMAKLPEGTGQLVFDIGKGIISVILGMGL